MKPLHRESRLMIADARSDGPSAEATARMWRLLSQRIHAPLPPKAAAANEALETPAGAGAAWTSSTIVKLVIGLSVCAAIGAGVTWRYRSQLPGASGVELPFDAAAERPPAVPSQQAPTLSEPPAPANARSSASGVRKSKSTVADMQLETRLIVEAQEALSAGEPKRALELLEQHRARFPRGMLAPEREAARVFALCALDRVAGATARARFLRKQPDSPMTARVRAACALSR